MIASRIAVDLGRAAELARPDDQRVVQQSAVWPDRPAASQSADRLCGTSRSLSCLKFCPCVSQVVSTPGLSRCQYTVTSRTPASSTPARQEQALAKRAAAVAVALVRRFLGEVERVAGRRSK